MRDDQRTREVPVLTFTVSNFNPNHRVRFVGFSIPTIRYLFDLSSAVGDDSFYLAPKFVMDAVISGQQPGQAPLIKKAGPGDELHLSFHESGAVNLHVAGVRTVLRSDDTGRGPQGLTLRLVFSSLRLFEEASIADFNALPKRYTSVPVTGFWEQHPVCLDIYQWNRHEPWSMPHLADIFQVHARIQPNRKASDYHFLVWQHTKAERYPADLALLYSPQPAQSLPSV
jgi:hypothetical protein